MAVNLHQQLNRLSLPVSTNIRTHVIPSRQLHFMNEIRFSFILHFSICTLHLITQNPLDIE